MGWPAASCCCFDSQLLLRRAEVPPSEDRKSAPATLTQAPTSIVDYRPFERRAGLGAC